DFQSRMPEQDGVISVALAHHPPDWLLDGDSVEDDLSSRAHLQLFGHKHRNRVRPWVQSLRCVAGAVHPEPGGQGADWVPAYQILDLVAAGQRWDCSVWARRWSDEYRH